MYTGALTVLIVTAFALSWEQPCDPLPFLLLPSRLFVD